MGLWDGIEDAQLRGQGVYLDAGFVGVLRVKKTLAMLTEQSGMAFICELEVVESNMPKFPPGMQVSWFQKMVNPKVAFPAITEWAAACCGYEDKEAIKRDVSPVLKNAMEHATNNPETNGFIGKLVRVEVVPKITKEKKIEISIYRFKPYHVAAA